MNDKDSAVYGHLDQETLKRIQAYSGPLERRQVTINVCDISHYSFDELPTTIDDWVVWLENAKSKIPAEFIDSHTCVLSWEDGYYDSGDSAELTVSYIRPETDEEMTTRIERGLQYVRECDASERRQYESLKKKFDK